MARNLTDQVREIAEVSLAVFPSDLICQYLMTGHQVTKSVARGDLSRLITAEAQGEILEMKVRDIRI